LFRIGMRDVLRDGMLSFGVDWDSDREMEEEG
jgi:hypothetical protein